MNDEALADEEREAIQQLIDLVESEPEKEGEIAAVVIQELFSQIRTYKAAQFAGLPKPGSSIGTDAPAIETVPVVDEREARVKANAQTELDVLLAASRERQEAAEAAAAEAQEDRRDNA